MKVTNLVFSKANGEKFEPIGDFHISEIDGLSYIPTIQNAYEMISNHGAVATTTYYQTRILSFALSILKNENNTNRRKVIDFFNATSRLRVDFMVGDTYYFINVRPNTAPKFAVASIQNKTLWEKCTVELIADNPFIFKTQPTRNQIENITGLFEFDYYFNNDEGSNGAVAPYGRPLGVLNTSNDGINVFNGGQDECGFNLKVYGIVDYFEMTVSNGAKFIINYTFNEGDYLEINAYQKFEISAKNINGDKVNILKNLDFINSTLKLLSIGQNSISFEGTTFNEYRKFELEIFERIVGL
jgi:hypothetical protein